MFLSLINVYKIRILQYIQFELCVKIIIEVENISFIIMYRIIDNLQIFNTHIAPFMIKKDKLFAIFSITKIELKTFIENKL